MEGRDAHRLPAGAQLVAESDLVVAERLVRAEPF
jgi:hypothetical protein